MIIKYQVQLFVVAVQIMLVPFVYPHALIIGHGAFAQSQRWFRQGGDFYQAVVQGATSLPVEYRDQSWTVVPFAWSQPFGGIFDVEKLRAAYQLLEQINKLRAAGHQKVYLFMHSYGGHVAILAAQLASGTLQLQRPWGDDLVRDMAAVQGAKRDFVAFVRAFKQYCKGARAIARRSTQATGPLIGLLYTAGTPHDLLQFWPPFGPDALGNLINFFSSGDRIQELVGARRITGPMPPECVNVQVRLELEPERAQDPGHCQLHHTVLGHWLLWIPHVLKALGPGGWQEFVFGLDGVLTLPGSTDCYPTYRVLNPPSA